MRGEIVGVGTELLLGQIANTNAQHLSQELTVAGVDIFLHTAVGDNLQRVERVIRQSLQRSDVVVVTGGLGPTPDDLTREAVAAALDVPLVRDEELTATVRGIFEDMGRTMPEDNLRQADLPQGAVPIPPEGTAPGFMIEHHGAVLFALPGVPWEMRLMLGKTVLPALARRGETSVLVTRQVLVIGPGESGAHETIKDIVAQQSNPTIAFLASAGQVHVRITAKAATTAEAESLIAPLEKQIRDRLGAAAVPGHFDNAAQALAGIAMAKGVSVAAAESLTGGLLAAQLTDAPGASDYFLGSLVTYSPASKGALAGVPQEILDGPGAISEEAAAALAQGAAARFGADLGLSTTGVAGPAESEGKPPGVVYVGACMSGRTHVARVQGHGDRDNVRRMAVTAALNLARRLVAGEE